MILDKIIEEKKRIVSAQKKLFPQDGFSTQDKAKTRSLKSHLQVRDSG